jgi:hypothetical protein
MRGEKREDATKRQTQKRERDELTMAEFAGRAGRGGRKLGHAETALSTLDAYFPAPRASTSASTVASAYLRRPTATSLTSANAEAGARSSVPRCICSHCSARCHRTAGAQSSGAIDGR